MSLINLTVEQEQVVEDILVWFMRKRKPVFSVAGFAGTGKSTILKYAIERLQLSADEVRYVTYTGKASLVLIRKGLSAQTIHSFCYEPKLTSYRCPHTRLMKTKISGFRLATTVDPAIKLLVIDEVSMVSDKLMADLLSFKIPILVMGDPGQLPPVRGKQNDLLIKPDAFLQKIHRQAANSPIIRLSMDARDGRPIRIGDYGQGVRVIPRSQVTVDELLAHSQVITCLHRNRIAYNTAIRSYLGYGKLPALGDKLVCLKNDWESISSKTFTPLVNGLQARLHEPIHSVSQNNRSLMMTVEAEGVPGDLYYELEANLDYFDPIDGRAPDTESKMTHWDFGYAITCHRSQGSEWDSVLFLADTFGGIEEQKQLIYTGVTRASSILTVAI